MKDDARKFLVLLSRMTWNKSLPLHTKFVGKGVQIRGKPLGGINGRVLAYQDHIRERAPKFNTSTAAEHSTKGVRQLRVYDGLYKYHVNYEVQMRETS